MEIEYKGANCVKIATKTATAFVDANIAQNGLKVNLSKANVILATEPTQKVDAGDMFFIDMPGEYEISGLGIKGVAARAHMDTEDQKNATIYKIMTAEASVVVAGHIYPELSEEQLETIGVTDILIVPVGGNGFTLDTTGAVRIIRKIDPKIVIPTHYAESGINYEVPQNDLELFLKELGKEAEQIDKLKLKGGILPESLAVYQLRKG